jgi:hypothetical protein
MIPGCDRSQTITGLCTRHNDKEARAEERWRVEQRRKKPGKPDSIEELTERSSDHG